MFCAVIQRLSPDSAIDGVLISRAEQPGVPSASMSGTVLALIAQGAKRIAVGDHVHDYRAGQYLIASVDLPVAGHYTEASPERPALGFGLILQPAAIAELLLRADPGDIPPAGGGAPSGLAVSDASGELVDAVIRLLLATHRGDVTGVGYRVGYDSPSQFSREYRRQFGVPPSRDAGRVPGPAPSLP
jgi:hypothetical protein